MMTYFLLGRAVSPTHSETDLSVCYTQKESMHSVDPLADIAQTIGTSTKAPHNPPQPSAEPEKRKREEEHTELSVLNVPEGYHPARVP